MQNNIRERRFLKVKEIVVFSMLGTVMLFGDVLMEMLPNIHFVGVLTVIYTMVYRKKALIPLYIYVFLNGLLAGFSLWWIPYLYIWTILWGLAMLIPKNIHISIAALLCAILSGLHGFAFGALYAPAQAIMFGLDLNGMIAWIIAGLPFDLIHGIANLAASVVIIPIVTLLCRLERLPLPFRITKKAENK